MPEEGDFRDVSGDTSCRGQGKRQALCFDWPDDPAVWDHPFEYLLGDDLLVAPVTEPGTTSLEVYLPAGRWIDAWTGAAFTGPRLLCSDVPLGAIPVFVREGAAGSLLPLFAEG